MKSLMEEIKKEKGKERFSFLSGILKGKTDLSLKEIQSFKYKAKSLNEISSWYSYTLLIFWKSEKIK